MKKNKNSSKDLIWLMREKGRRKWGKNYIHLLCFCFGLLFWEAILLPYWLNNLIGITAFLLQWSDHYMLPGNICSTTNIPAALRTTWLNCSLFGNWVSQSWCLNSAVRFALPEDASGTHNSSICAPVPSFFESSSAMDLRLVSISLFPLRHLLHVWQASHLHTNHCLGFGVTFGSPRPCS